MKQMWFRVLSVGVASLFAFSLSALAIGPGGGQGPAALKQIKELAGSFDISPDKIHSLIDSGLDVGQAKDALSMAKDVVAKGELSMDAAVDKITAMVKDGAGLEDIAKKLDVDLPSPDAIEGDAADAAEQVKDKLGEAKKGPGLKR